MSVRRSTIIAALAGLLFMAFATSVHALESDAVVSPRNRVTVISDIDTVEPGKPFHIALRFRLTKGWHVYWSNPGDAGQPPAMRVHVPDGAMVSGIEWPTPIRLAEGPVMVFAYVGDVALPATVTTPVSIDGGSFKIGVNADWLVCAKSCVPETGHFELSIPAGKTTVSKQAPLIASSLARVPQSSPFTAQVTDKAALVIKDPNLSAKTVSAAWFFPDKWGAVQHAAQQDLSFTDGGVALNLKAGPLFNPGTSLSGILVLKDAGGHESYYNLSVSPEAAAAGDASSLAKMMFFGLLGGLILNLMPCVFPVLAMKALSIAGLSGAEREHVSKHALLYTLGVLVAFVALALLLLALRATGSAIGWGFQFQSPTFVTAMAWLLFALGLNLSGIYVVGTRMMGMGESQASRKSAAGSFFTGLLAVVVATPCVAPFVGVAIAAALTSSVAGMIAIFLAMGLGLALPYILLAVFPGTIRVLPRPGQWMETLRQALAFPMYGGSAWLLWVLNRQDGADGLAYALSGTIVLGFSAWLYGHVKPKRNSGCMVRLVLVCASLLCICFLLYRIAELPAANAAASEHRVQNEEPYSVTRLAELRAANTPVFIDMTAAWCITCLVNERVAISSDAVQAAFARDHIVYMKGDWTQQDPAITAFLKQHGADGVPLYVYFPAQGGASVTLPQILTPSIILDTIDHPAT